MDARLGFFKKLNIPTVNTNNIGENLNMLSNVRHIITRGMDTIEFLVLANATPNMPRFRLSVLPKEDIYESKSYEYDGKINPESPELEAIFNYRLPEITRVSNGVVEIAFKHKFYSDVNIVLHKLSLEDAARRRLEDAITNDTVNHLLTERIKKLEQKMSILGKL